jgi:hypothetical protein
MWNKRGKYEASRIENEREMNLKIPFLLLLLLCG